MAQSMRNTQKSGTFELGNGMAVEKQDFLLESRNVDTYLSFQF